MQAGAELYFDWNIMQLITWEDRLGSLCEKTASAVVHARYRQRDGAKSEDMSEKRKIISIWLYFNDIGN